MNVPFMDLKRQYLKIKSEIDGALQETIDACAFVSGKMVKKFEEDFARYCGVKYAVCVSNGTSALYVALKALNIGKGDGVITVPFTFIATIEAISMTGAQPLLVDIDQDSYTISLSKLKAYLEQDCEFHKEKNILIDKKHNVIVRAIIPVHLYGQMCAMEPLLQLAQQYGLAVIEDGAQAHGATYKDQKAGTFGALGCFSFYPSKNLGAFGQGGAIVTNDKTLAESARIFIDHGQSKKYEHNIEGWNFKMDGFQAAILDVKLKYLDKWNNLRQEHAQLYNKLLKGSNGLELPVQLPERKHIYHLYVVRSSNRFELQAYLADNGIGSSIHYPTPIHTQPAYKHLGHKTGDFPIAETCAAQVLSLPMFPELESSEIEYVCNRIKTYYNQKK